jgi:hypothetical protein
MPNKWTTNGPFHLGIDLGAVYLVQGNRHHVTALSPWDKRRFSRKKLDHGYAAPDELEIFFGTKFDIGALLAKLGISPF